MAREREKISQERQAEARRLRTVFGKMLTVVRKIEYEIDTAWNRASYVEDEARSQSVRPELESYDVSDVNAARELQSAENALRRADILIVEYIKMRMTEAKDKQLLRYYFDMASRFDS